MKKSGTQRFRLGLFVLIGTALFVAAVYLIGQRQHLFKKTFTINAFFQNVNGLQKGNNVRYSGINIGTVNAIDMINDSTIKVAMDIDVKIIGHIKKNAIATIGSDGLVGNMIVNIVPGKGTSPGISNGDTIESYSKIGADDILSTLSVTNENAAILTSDLLKITNAMIDGQGTLGILLNDTLMANDLKQSISNIKLASYSASKAINELNDFIGSIKTDDESLLGTMLYDSVSARKLKTIINNLEVTSTEIEHLVRDVNLFVNDLNSSQGTMNYLVKDTTLVNSLKSTLININEGTEKFNENMEALKYNFLTRAYFRKQERKAKKENDNK